MTKKELKSNLISMRNELEQDVSTLTSRDFGTVKIYAYKNRRILIEVEDKTGRMAPMPFFLDKDISRTTEVISKALGIN